MASNEPLAFSKIPKLRSAPSSPRVPAAAAGSVPSAPKLALKPTVEKSKSNMSSSSRIPQMTFRKRHTTSIAGANTTPPGSGSKIPRKTSSTTPRGVSYPKRETVGVATTVEASTMDGVLANSQGDVLTSSLIEVAAPIKVKSQSGSVKPISSEETGKSQCDIPAIRQTEMVAPIKEKTQPSCGPAGAKKAGPGPVVPISSEEAVNALVGMILPSSLHNIALPATVKEKKLTLESSPPPPIIEVNQEREPEAVEPAPVQIQEIPNPFRSADLFFDEVFQSAAKESQDISAQFAHPHLARSYSANPHRLTNQQFHWSAPGVNKPAPPAEVEVIVPSPPKNSQIEVENEVDFASASLSVARPSTSRTNSYLSMYLEQVEQTEKAVQRVHSQDFDLEEDEHPQPVLLGEPETRDSDQAYPYAYDESFQLRKASDAEAAGENGNILQDDDDGDEEDPVETTTDVDDTELDYHYYDTETDLSFGGEDEDGLEQDDSVEELELEQGGNNDLLLLSTMINSKCNDGSGRKTKTIFSVDAPSANAQKEEGPGVNGDGLGAHYTSSEKLVSASLAPGGSKEKEVEVLYRKKDGPRYVLPEIEVDTDEVEELELEEQVREECDWLTEQKQCPRLNAMNGYVEILPGLDSGAGSLNSLHSSTGSKSFNLILQRSKTEIGEEYEKSLEIANLTRFPHGFQIWCNSSAYSHLRVSPNMGVIRPGAVLAVEVKARNPQAHGMEFDTDQDRMEVRVFQVPADCAGVDELRKCYEKLMEARPGLVAAQSIQRLILWDANDISGRLELFDSIEDEEEIASLKDELHDIQLGQCSPQPMSMTMFPSSPSPTAAASLLHYVKEQVNITDYNLRAVLKEMASIRSAQQIIFILLFCFMSMSYVCPRMFQDVRDMRAAAKAAEDTSMWTALLRKVGLK